MKWKRTNIPDTAKQSTGYHPDTSGYHRIPPGYHQIPPGYHPDTTGYRPDTTGQPPTRQNTTRRNAAKQTNQNKAECRRKEAECPQQNNVQGGMPPNKQTKTLNAANAASCDAKHKRLFSPLKGQNLSLVNGPQTLSPWSLRVTAGNIPAHKQINSNKAERGRTNKKQQGGMPPNQQTTTRRSAAKQTKTEVKTISRKQLRRLKNIDTAACN